MTNTKLLHVTPADDDKPRKPIKAVIELPPEGRDTDNRWVLCDIVDWTDDGYPIVKLPNYFHLVEDEDDGLT